MAPPNSREQLADLWRRYKLALERLDWALNELAKTPQVKEESPPPPQSESRRDYDPPPINPRPKPADDEEPIIPLEKVRQFYNNQVIIPDFSINSDNGEPSVNAGFGTKFPEDPKKGDMFLRVDFLPSKLFKWNEKKWIEVDKDQVDQLAYNHQYIRHLINKIRSGEYDMDMLSPTEQDQIQRYINEQRDE